MLLAAGQRPFKVIFNTDANEVVNMNAAGNADGDEQSSGTGGTTGASGLTGFSLDFTQGTC